MKNAMIVLILLFASCADQEEDSLTQRISPSAEALEHGSCEDSCGERSPDGCHCDAECPTYGDCCPDYADTCSINSDCQVAACEDGSAPVDTDGDGCGDACVSSDCQVAACEDGTAPVDTDGDGCGETCPDGGV